MVSTERRNALKVAAASLLAPLLPGCAGAPPRPTSLNRGDYAAVGAYLQSLIAYEMKERKITGLSIALVDDQRVVWQHGAGWADQEAAIPATAHTLYRVGSVSKLFTVVAALQLAEAGRLDLDRPLQEVLPTFAPRSRFPDAPITPRLLMTHHAGLPRDVIQGMWGSQPGDFRGLVAESSQTALAYPPGQNLSYSNLGMSLLGVAIEQLAGRPFADHMQAAVLNPAGMRTASFSVAPPATPFMAKAYLNHVPHQEPALRDVPAGGLNASVEDLSAFLQQIFAGGGPLLNSATVAQMLRPQFASTPLDFDARVGLGWFISSLGDNTDEEAGPVLGHNGATIYHRAELMCLPRHKLGVVLASASATSGEALAAIGRQALFQALEAKTGHRLLGYAPPFQPASWSEDVRSRYSGAYATQVGLLRVSKKGDGLVAHVGDQTLNLRTGADGYAYPRASLFGILSLPMDALEDVSVRLQQRANRDLLVVRRHGREYLFGEKLQPYPLLDWEALTGTYYPVAEPGGDLGLVHSVRLFVSEGFLLAQVRMSQDGDDDPGTLVLRPLTNQTALVLGPLADQGEEIRYRPGKMAPQLEFQGLRFFRRQA